MDFFSREYNFLRKKFYLISLRYYASLICLPQLENRQNPDLLLEFIRKFILI